MHSKIRTSHRIIAWQIMLAKQTVQLCGSQYSTNAIPSTKRSGVHVLSGAGAVTHTDMTTMNTMFGTNHSNGVIAAIK
mgnify:CR=1 FL=1